MLWIVWVERVAGRKLLGFELVQFIQVLVCSNNVFILQYVEM